MLKRPRGGGGGRNKKELSLGPGTPDTHESPKRLDVSKLQKVHGEERKWSTTKAPVPIPTVRSPSKHLPLN